MYRRLLLVLIPFFLLNFALIVFYLPISGSILGEVIAPTVNVSASIPEIDTIPPTITYISPINLQQNVPADADIQVEISDGFSGVNINTVQIVINGVIYDNLTTNPYVTVTGNTALYNIVVHPIDPLLINQTNTVTTSGNDLANNFAQSSITFNTPITPTSTPTPGPTSTPTPGPTSTPTPGTTTSTPTPIIPTVTPGGPTLTPTRIIPTITPGGPTKIPTPTTTTIPYCLPIVTPTIFPSTTTPDLSPPEIEFIKPSNNSVVSLNPSTVIKISDSGSGVNLNSIKISLDKNLKTAVNPDFTYNGDPSSYTITTKFTQPLLPNSNFYLIVYVSDLAGNRITKSINLKTENPIINQVMTTSESSIRIPGFILFLLLLFLIIGIILYIFNKIKELNYTEGHPIALVFNSLTLEPLSGIHVQIFDANNHKIGTSTTNIFGILASKISTGKYHLTIKNKNYSFPTVSHLKKHDFPTPYVGKPFSTSKTTDTYLDIPIDPFANKSFEYHLHQYFLPKMGIITNKQKEPQIGVKLGLKETKFNSLVTTRISDSNGQYRFIVPHGRYQLIIVGTNTIIETIDTRHLVNGYTTINKNIVI